MPRINAYRIWVVGHQFALCQVLVGQVLFIPSLFEGLPVPVCGGDIPLDTQECLSYQAN